MMDQNVDDVSPLALIPADVLQQVLRKLPFLDLVSLRVICKKWNAVICSLHVAPHHVPKCVPVHFLNGELTVYNSRLKAWEEHSLSFFQEHIRTKRLELVATAGGLICFETDKPDQLIVCNPISKLWKVVQIPLGARIGDDTTFKAAAAGSPCTGVLASSGSDFSGEDYRRAVVLRTRRTIVGLLVDLVTGNHYKIVVASLPDKCAPTSASGTLVYDSLTSSWTGGAKVPEGEEFADGEAILCNGSLYCLVKTETFNGELFRYDVKSDRWSTLSLDMSVMRCKLVEHCGRVLLVRRNAYYSDESPFRFFHLRDNTNHFSTSGAGTGTAPTADDDLSMKSLEETDLIESLNLDPASIMRVSGHLKSTGRGYVLGQKNCLLVLKPPYEDGLKKKRTLVTIIDLLTGSCDVLRELIVASATSDTGSIASEKHRIRNVFHLFSASVTVQV